MAPHKRRLSTRRVTYHDFVLYLIRLIQRDNEPVRRVEVDQEFLKSLQPALAMGAIDATDLKSYQSIVEDKKEDKWWAYVAQVKFDLSNEEIRSARQIEAREGAGRAEADADIKDTKADQKVKRANKKHDLRR
ncbi:MAG: hypothetical protein M1835_002026 [Candelina submexicana]|nr:MAG: hypothetical protein M1835_002026 [Candelina submexicana]